MVLGDKEFEENNMFETILGGSFIAEVKPNFVSMTTSPEMEASYIENHGNSSAKTNTNVHRKKQNLWTHEEHRQFLMGLELYGKGSWKSISRNYLPTKTPTQIASHAQKYYLRQVSQRKRASIHDITTANYRSVIPNPNNGISQSQPNNNAMSNNINNNVMPHNINNNVMSNNINNNVMPHNINNNVMSNNINNNVNASQHQQRCHDSLQLTFPGSMDFQNFGFMLTKKS